MEVGIDARTFRARFRVMKAAQRRAGRQSVVAVPRCCCWDSVLEWQCQPWRAGTKTCSKPSLGLTVCALAGDVDDHLAVTGVDADQL